MPPRIFPDVTGSRNYLGPWLKKLRQRRGETISGLAARLQRAGWDVSRPVVSYIESGKRILSDTELLMILKVLNCSPSDLEEGFASFPLENGKGEKRRA